MKKLAMSIMLLVTSFFISTMVMAETPNSPAEPQYNERGQIMLETIDRLTNEGYITIKNANEAKKEFVFNDSSLKKLKEIAALKEKESSSEDLSVTLLEYFNFINVLKTLGVIAFLVAFRGVLLKVIIKFAEIPMILYQVILMSVSLLLTFNPSVLFESHSSYIAMFGVVSNVMIMGWIISTYQIFFEKLFKVFSLNMPVEIVLPFYFSLYFGGFAILLESQFLGVLSMLAFVAMFGFMFITTGLTTLIGFDKDDFILPSVFINGLILFTYSWVKLNNEDVPYLDIFSSGIEYVLSLCLVVALLIKSSPFSQDEDGFSVSCLLMFVAFGFGLAGAFLFNLTVIPAFLNTAFFLFAAGWVCYMISHLGGIALAFGLGGMLYGTAVLMEKFPELFITSLF